MKPAQKLDLLFCVNGNKTIGLGHVSRSIRLAEFARKKNPQLKISFLTYGSGQTFKLLSSHRFQFTKLQSPNNFYEKKAILNNLSASIILHDIWQTSSRAYFSLLKKNCQSLVAFDQRQLGFGIADSVINSLPCTYQHLSQKTKTSYYQGLKYLNLPLDLTSKKSTLSADLLIVLGGSDRANLTPIIASKIAQALPQIKITAVSHQKTTQVNNLKTVKPFSIPLAQLFNSHQIVLTSGGMTMFEALVYKKPVLAYASMSWEIKNINFLARQDLVAYLGSYRSHPDKIIRQSLKKITASKAHPPKTTIDNQGLKRIWQIISSYLQP